MSRRILDKIRALFKCSYIFILLATLTACADSEVANKLANSFDTPLENNKTLKEDPTGEKEFSMAPNSDSSKKNQRLQIKRKAIKENGLQTTLTSKKVANPLKNTKQRSKYTPQPYRVILKISDANPSAPAEKVTRVLRDAGVLFEVEKIEQYEQKTSNTKTREVKRF